MKSSTGTKSQSASPQSIESRVEVKLSDIKADFEWNSRGPIAPAECLNLAKSIERDKQRIPVELAYSNGEKPYSLVAGFRRFVAVKLLGWETILANIQHYATDDEKLAVNWIENNKRSDLTYLQQAMAMAVRFGVDADAEEVANALGENKRWVERRQAIMRLPPKAQMMVETGEITLYDVERIAKQHETQQARMEAARRAALRRSLKGGKVGGHLMGRSTLRAMITHMVNQGIEGLAVEALMYASGDMPPHEFVACVKEAAEKKNNE